MTPAWPCAGNERRQARKCFRFASGFYAPWAPPARQTRTLQNTPRHPVHRQESFRFSFPKTPCAGGLTRTLSMKNRDDGKFCP